MRSRTARPTRVCKRLAALALSLLVRSCDVVSGPLRSVLGVRRRGRGVVLYYHGIRAHQRARFAWQMDELLRRSRPFAAGVPESMTDDAWHAAITFDDAFRSVVDHAVPELVQRRIPFTVFVPTGCLGRPPSWVRHPEHRSVGERVLDQFELRALVGLPLASVGAHSVTHRNLAALDIAAATAELADSRATLQAVTGVPVDLFSFPHGTHNATLLDVARRVGYSRVFTVEPTVTIGDSAAFAIGRVAVEPDDWKLEFRLKVTGAYRWRHLLHRLRRAA